VDTCSGGTYGVVMLDCGERLPGNSRCMQVYTVVCFEACDVGASEGSRQLAFQRVCTVGERSV
jgi:hypothetical protein